MQFYDKDRAKTPKSSGQYHRGAPALADEQFLAPPSDPTQAHKPPAQKKSTRKAPLRFVK